MTYFPKRAWTLEEIAELHLCADAGMDIYAVCALLNRSFHSVSRKTTDLCLELHRPPPPVVPRWAPMPDVRFEDMPRAIIEREWPSGRVWNWRRLV